MSKLEVKCPECGRLMQVFRECGVWVLHCAYCCYQLNLKHFSPKRHGEPAKEDDECRERKAQK